MARKPKTPRPNTASDPVTFYAKEVTAGRIVAGPWVRAACARHLRDLVEGPKRGLRWDLDAALRAINFFPDVLCLNGGQFEGIPFELHLSQKFRVGSLFGWKRSNGLRRFRRFYDEESKGSGKSPMLAGIGLYCLLADGEARAEVYAAASKKDQAMVLFRDAVAMVDQSPALFRRITKSGGNPVWNLADLQTGSFFRPISSDDGQSGPRPHCALCDEVHEHKNRDTIDMLERGFKWRLQPLLCMATNSGTDRTSICWEEHCHAINVARGHDDNGLPVEDDSTFSYVCALDSERTETYPFDIAIRHAAESCTCNAQITLSDLPSPQDFAALVTQGSGAQIISQRGSGASITPSVRLLLSAFASTAIPRDAKNAARKPSSAAKNIRENGPSLPKALRATGNGTESTERKSGRRTRTGAGTVHAGLSTGSPSSRLSKSAPDSGMDAPSAGGKMTVSEWITATIQELCGDCSATPAILESVCSEIMSRLYSGHSNTCKVRQRFRLASGRLTEDLPADDPLTDPSCWIKANPLLGVTVTEETLAAAAKQARQMPGKANSIKRLNFCIWTDAEEAWITKELWDSVQADFDPREHIGHKVYIGLDLSAVKDLTAEAHVVQTGTVERRDEAGNVKHLPTFDAWVNFWTPGATLAERALADRVPYEVWVDEGHIFAPPGRIVRLDYVAQHIVEESQDFEMGVIAYDRYAIKNLEREFDDLGATLPLVEHPQGFRRVSVLRDTEGEAVRDETGRQVENPLWMPSSINGLEELILDGRIRIKRSPVLTYNAASACFDTDPQGNRKFAKTKATGRIDGVVALAEAVGAALANVDSSGSPSPYEERGLLVF